MRTLVCLLLVASAGEDELARAKEKIRALNYPAALQALAAAEAADGATAEQLWEVYELEGTALATLKRPQEAVERFERLLALRPDHRFATPRAPRVMTPYYEARDWLKYHAPLEIVLKPTRNAAAELTVEISVNDALGWVEQLDLEIVEDGTSRSLHEPKAKWPPAALRSKAKSVQINAVAIGPHHQQLARATLTNEASAPAPTPDLAPRIAEAPSPPPMPPAAIDLRGEPKRSSGGLRIAGIVAVGVGAAAMATGIYFGVLSHQDVSSFNDALSKSMADGASPLTRMQAQTLSDDKQRDAWVANALFGTAAALAILGLAFILFGGPST